MNKYNHEHDQVELNLFFLKVIDKYLILIYKISEFDKNN